MTLPPSLLTSFQCSAVFPQRSRHALGMTIAPLAATAPFLCSLDRLRKIRGAGTIMYSSTDKILQYGILEGRYRDSYTTQVCLAVRRPGGVSSAFTFPRRASYPAAIFIRSCRLTYGSRTNCQSSTSNAARIDLVAQWCIPNQPRRLSRSYILSPVLEACRTFLEYRAGLALSRSPSWLIEEVP